MRPAFLLIAVLLGAGCAKKETAPASSAPAPSATSAANAPEKTETPGSLNVATTAGSADRTDPVTGAKLYDIQWKSAAITIGRAGLQEGRMNGVSGTVYEEGRKKSAYTAETGYAKKASGDLRLEGRVVVKSPQYGSTLTARKLEWLPDVKRYRATGEVRVTGEWGTIGPADVLLATSDLKTVGTPDAFIKKVPAPKASSPPALPTPK